MKDLSGRMKGSLQILMMMSTDNDDKDDKDSTVQVLA